jgi:very-short-patch-repair endonuclease
MTAIERVIGELAQKNDGYVHRSDLLALALTRAAIRHRVDRGFLIPVHHDVYAVGHVPADPIARAAGALLACGPEPGLSHASGGTMWGIFPEWREPFEVSTHLDRRPRGIRVHHRPTLLPEDMTVLHGRRVTSAPLTLLDNTPALSDRRLVRALNWLRLEHRLQLEELEAVVARLPRHRGARRVRRLLLTATDEPTRSCFEDEWPPFARRSNLTGWAMNHVICGHRVDVIFLPNLLIVELDGWATHATPSGFEDDRDRDGDILARTGIPIMRITYRQFHEDPDRQAERIHRILADRRRIVSRAA